MTPPVLSVDGLRVTIDGRPVVDGVDFSVEAGEIVTLVGESGCGKSMTAFAVMGLLPQVARQEGGNIWLGGEPIGKGRRSGLRGTNMAMIFQEPVASLNPLMPIGWQIAECLIVHRRLTRREAKRQTIAMLSDVGIPEPEIRYRQYPFELSGGMCQRAMIAMALITRPKLLIADEPTTALDVTIQAQILELMKRLRDETNTAILLITHDMGVVADIADQVAVMYAGRVVETAPVDDIFAWQAHPYTKLLLSTIPRLDGEAKTLLPTIRGTVPRIGDWPVGCRFSTRCPLADDDCREDPPLAPAGLGRLAACWHQDRVGGLA
ncbi:ABC transporter ATP-binding protein [Rhizobium tumorigenes]|uniref:ABC transporter ATP-binding protein n=1 Tax=Rhizobium tumorigenes TaxID=2041385 RepID=A0AAF1KLN6_9HYPH|nr:ABC transporter ATP-binding protein [Rhizobium tumorigenes]WFR97866.1 ABC transporter ATP-binding protein [Rhizobium tumorigenes]WFS03425.1 ABC transporter ATP-binding protein [Rhizobium tumorigenes]